jgi:hypothetical protein
MPLDEKPIVGGNIMLSTDRKTILTILKTRHTENPDPLYVSHFATCPNAAKHRKKGATRQCP